MKEVEKVKAVKVKEVEKRCPHRLREEKLRGPQVIGRSDDRVIGCDRKRSAAALERRFASDHRDIRPSVARGAKFRASLTKRKGFRFPTLCRMLTAICFDALKGAYHENHSCHTDVR